MVKCCTMLQTDAVVHVSWVDNSLVLGQCILRLSRLPEAHDSNLLREIQPGRTEAFHHELVLVLVINEVDRLCTQLRPDASEAYVRIREQIESINACNVIVEETSGGYYAAVLIDLSRATVLTSRDAGQHRPSSCQDKKEKARCNDLKDLGCVFCELCHDNEQQMCDYNSIEAWRHHLYGVSIDIEMDDETVASREKRERRATDADGGLPAYLSALI